MGRKLLIAFLSILLGVSIISCDGKYVPNAKLVKEINKDSLTGNWNFSPTFFNKKMVENEKSYYWELSKEKLSVQLDTTGLIKLLDDQGKIIDSGKWDLYAYPNDEVFQNSVALKFSFLNDSLLSGSYFMTRRSDSLYIFKPIWNDNPDSSDYMRFSKLLKKNQN